jgi:DNA polymerase-1
MVMDWCVAEVDPKHGLKHSGLKWLKWRRQSYSGLFSYVPDGKKKPVILMPSQIMAKDLPDEMLRVCSAEEWINRFVDYSGDDAEQTIALYKVLRKKLKDRGYWDEYLRVDRPFTISLRHCAERGVLLDQPRLRDLEDEVYKEMLRLTRVFRDESGRPDINLNSIQQLQKLFFDDLDWPRRKDLMTDKGQPQLNRIALNWYADEHGFSLADHLRRFRKLKTLKGTFLTGLLKGVDDDGRLRSDFNQIGATSGRISSRKIERQIEVTRTLKSGKQKTTTKKVKVGANLQNIPSARNDPYGVRGAFIARPGYQILCADMSAFELYMAIYNASKTGPSKMLNILKAGGDIHSMTAHVLCDLDCPIEDVKTLHKELRDNVGKTCNFNLLYGGGAKMLCSIIGWDHRNPRHLKKAEGFIKKWHALWPEMGRYQKATVAFGYNHGYVETISGRRIHVKNLLESPDKWKRLHGERICMNGPCQGSAADIMKEAMNLIDQDEQLRDLKYEQLFPVHDEIVGEAPTPHAQTALDRKMELMRKPYKDALPFPLVVEGSYGDNWLIAK